MDRPTLRRAVDESDSPQPRRFIPEDDPDGSELLTSDSVADLLRAAVNHAGGTLLSWRLSHVDANPGQSTTATYQASVEWSFGERTELIGVSARASGLTSTDGRAEIFADGDREVAVWLYPKDPDLPGLSRVAYQDEVAAIINQYRILDHQVTGADITLSVIGYRPRRRAVIRVDIASGESLFIKVMRPRPFKQTVQRHRLLVDAGVPAPRILAATSDQIMVMEAMPGIPVAQALFSPSISIDPAELVWVLDRMPAAVSQLQRREPWIESLRHYSAMISDSLPSAAPLLDEIASRIERGTAMVPPGNEPTHGDFHEGQIFVDDGGHVCGIIDVDTLGPGRRADDLACMLAHLSTIHNMNASQEQQILGVICDWTRVFDRRVNPYDLRLRTAAVIISLATGPFRSQTPTWVDETWQMISAAHALVCQVPHSYIR